MTPPSQSLDPQVRIGLALALISLTIIVASFCMLMLIRWQRRVRRRPNASRRRSQPVIDPWSEAGRRVRVDPTDESER